jgi:hypothetical protein
MPTRLLPLLAIALCIAACSKDETTVAPPTTTGWTAYTRCEVTISKIDSITIPQRVVSGTMTIGSDRMRYHGELSGTVPDGTWKLALDVTATKLSQLDTATVVWSTYDQNPINPLDYFVAAQTVRLVALPAGAQADSAREFVALGTAAQPVFNLLRTVGTFYGSSSAGDWNVVLQPVAKAGTVLRLIFRK